ncbi:hypothetical protein Dimus_034103 [Dionaea muscipula]
MGMMLDLRWVRKPMKNLHDRQESVNPRQPIPCSSGGGNRVSLNAEQGEGVWQEVGRKNGGKHMLEDHDQRKACPAVHTLNRFDDLMSSEILLGKDEMIQTDFNPSTSYDPRCMERKRKHIPRLMRDDGSWATSKEDIVQTISNFYSSLLGSQLLTEEQFDEECFGAGPLLNDM